ncbi:MAG: response regulator [Elusimicrobia bacterium]|nr:response regulator [Elusimicrobiota bacterium]
MIAQILVADDNVDITLLLSEYLATRNHRVIVVNDGFALAQKAAEHKPHLIITDIQMPGAYGSSVYQVLQKDPKTASIPILFISAHPYEKLKNILPDDPKTRFLKKPIAFDKLDGAILELLPMGGYIP